MPIDRTAYNALVDDDGSNLVGTPWDKNKVKTVLLDPIDAALAAAGSAPGVTSPVTTGNVTAEPIPAGSGDLVTYHNNATLKTVQGMVAGTPGQRWTHISIGAGQVDFTHQDAAATAALRLINFATVGKTSLAAGFGTSIYVYDGAASRWRLISHEQGAWITPPYAAGNFTGNGAMTWTVDAGDIATYAYYLKGRTLHLAFLLSLTTVGGTLNTALQVAIPAGLTCAKIMIGFYRASDNAGAGGIGMFQTGAGGSVIPCYKDLTSTANWSAATNTTGLSGGITIEVN